jgi:hypothetical protein
MSSFPGSILAHRIPWPLTEENNALGKKNGMKPYDEAVELIWKTINVTPPMHHNDVERIVDLSIAC